MNSIYERMNGRKDVVKLLLELNTIDLNSKDISGWTPFVNTCIKGQNDTVKKVSSIVLCHITLCLF